MKKKSLYAYWSFEEVNPVIRARDPRWVEGVLAACNILSDYHSTTINGYNPGDIVLAKLNLIATSQIRKARKGGVK